MQPLSPDRPPEQALDVLRRHGWNAVSFQGLERGYSYFFDGPDAFVPYLDTGTAWVAGGAPVAPEERLGETAERFRAAAEAQGRRACFFGAAERLLRATHWRSLRIGDQPTWDPSRWAEVLASASSLRAQLRRAASHGVTVRRVSPAQLEPGTPTRVAVEALIDDWLRNRSMAPMGFLVDVQPFDFASERLVFVAERASRVVGFLSAVPIYARGGWLFEDLLRVRDAPNGTSELLVDAGMRAAAEAGAKLVTLGLAPLSGEVPRGLALARDLSRSLYDFAGVHAFKARLRPHGWEPLFIAVPTTASPWMALLDSLRAFARGSLAGFALRTLARGPPFIVAGLTLLLALWIPVLALAEPSRWFPAPWVHEAWVGFDVALLGLLVLLARRYRHGLGVLVASLVSADAVVTLAMAVAWNLPRLEGPVEAFAVALACLGPLIAARALWGMVRSRAGAITSWRTA